jgi:hypothetical protein
MGVKLILGNNITEEIEESNYMKRIKKIVMQMKILVIQVCHSLQILKMKGKKI